MAVEQLQEFTNNATTTVPSTINSGDLSITVATGDGALFPSLTGSEFFIATLVNTVALDPGFGDIEIVKVTARSGDVMTVVRAQEGTAANNYPTGVLFELRPTAQAFNNIYTEVLELETTKAPLASPVFTGNPQAPTPTAGDNDTSLATTAFVQTAISNTGYSRVLAQTGANNTGTPNTQYDFSAEAVVLRNPSTGSLVVRTTTGTVTNNVSTAGPTANGRDQAGAFSASSWIHFYWIWNGTTLATVSSTSAPPTGPTLPSGYTHWAYITAIRFDGSSALMRTLVRGSDVFYDIVAGGTTRVLLDGQATSFTTIANTATVIPPNAMSAHLVGIISANHNVVGAAFAAQFRPLNRTMTTANLNTVTATTSSTYQARNSFTFPLGDTSGIQYLINAAPATSGGVTVDVVGYKIQNGDS